MRTHQIHTIAFGRRILLLSLVALALSLASSLAARAGDPSDPGKGYDYVLYGFSPPYGPDGEGNRAMLLLDIDGLDSPRPSSLDRHFKLLVENATTSGRLDVESYTQHAFPTTVDTLLGSPDNFPTRYVFIYSGAGGIIHHNVALEALMRHYLRSVVDVVHNAARTRYLVNCQPLDCHKPFVPYPAQP